MLSESKLSIQPSIALMVVDMQPPFIRAVSHPETLMQRCCFAIEAACLFNICVLFTEQNPKKLQTTHPTLRALAPDAPVFPKLTFSALRAPDLNAFLEEHSIKHLLIAGLETPICIYQTVIEAQKNGFTVTLLNDCIDCRHIQDVDCALQALSQAGAHVLPSETVFYSILGDAGHPHFRTFNQMVKKYA